jgi:hypothetical protein
MPDTRLPTAAACSEHAQTRVDQVASLVVRDCCPVHFSTGLAAGSDWTLRVATTTMAALVEER